MSKIMARIPFLQYDLGQAIERLSAYPSAFVQSLGGGQAGWHMHALEVPAAPDRSPGVYSTAFAVRLLCATAKPERDDLRPMVVGGMRFLAQQWRDSEAVLRGEAVQCKQSDKMQEVGHTDFQLTLKCVAVLEAANAVADVRTHHEEFGKALDEAEDALNGVAARLKEKMIGWEETGHSYLGWPWHFLSNEPEWDVVPTAKAALALTHPIIRSTSRYLDAGHAAVNTLRAFLSSPATTVHKAIVCRSLVELRRQLVLDPEPLPSTFLGELSGATSHIDDLPWQEVVHYSVPYKAHKVSHYRPWMWVCPRLEIAEAALLTDPDGGLRRAAATAVELLRNMRTNRGAVRFLSAQPPTLLATLEASRFLKAIRAVLGPSLERQATFAGTWLSLSLRRVLQVHWWLPYCLLLSLLLYSQLPLLSAAETSWQKALTLLGTTLGRFTAVWPVWLFVSAVHMLIAEGSWSRRLKSLVRVLAFTVLLGILVNLLAASK